MTNGEKPKRPKKKARKAPKDRMLDLIEKMDDRISSFNDETQRKMDFIIEQQAQFTVDIQQLTSTQAETTQLVGRLAQASLERINNLEEKMSALVDAQIKTEDRVSELAAVQKETSERLNVFINVVERYISEGRNGKS